MFVTPFDSHACIGDSITCEEEGFEIVATIHEDDDDTPPWDRDELHGPVSDWTDRDRRSGEKVLKEDGCLRRYYDFAEAFRTARREQWYAPPLDAEANIDAGAEHDYEVLRAWCNDEWSFVGVDVVVLRDGIPLNKWVRARGVGCGMQSSQHGKRLFAGDRQPTADGGVGRGEGEMPRAWEPRGELLSWRQDEQRISRQFAVSKFVR